MGTAGTAYRVFALCCLQFGEIKARCAVTLALSVQQDGIFYIVELDAEPYLHFYLVGQETLDVGFRGC